MKLVNMAKTLSYECYPVHFHKLKKCKKRHSRFNDYAKLSRGYKIPKLYRHPAASSYFTTFIRTRPSAKKEIPSAACSV